MLKMMVVVYSQLLIYSQLLTVYLGPKISRPFAVLTMYFMFESFRNCSFITPLYPPRNIPPLSAVGGSMVLGTFSALCEYAIAC